MTKLSRATLCVWLLAGPLGLALGGCPMAAWFAAQFGPKEEIKALYEPPSDKKILVFVDDYFHRVTYEPVEAVFRSLAYPL